MGFNRIIGPKSNMDQSAGHDIQLVGLSRINELMPALFE